MLIRSPPAGGGGAGLLEPEPLPPPLSLLGPALSCLVDPFFRDGCWLVSAVLESGGEGESSH